MDICRGEKNERKKYRSRINRKTGHVASFIQPLERGFSGFLDFLLTRVYPLLNLKHELQIQHATRKEDSILDGIIMVYHVALDRFSLEISYLQI